MASLPARQPSQRRTSPTEHSTQSNASHSSRISQTASEGSEESQTIFARQEEQPAYPDSLEAANLSQTSQPESQIGRNVPPLNLDDDPSIKKCWICFSDSTEDTPETSPWRDPCQCALQAHEECLLDWIADMEAPRSTRQRGGLTLPKIECPQCKGEIKLARPKSYIVDAVNALERLSVRLVTPGAVLTLGGVVYSSSLAWGIHSIYAIFGAEDGFRILRPWIYNATRAPLEVYVGSPSDAYRQMYNFIVDHLVHWRLYVGLPIISPILILSRTSIADNFLPMLPIVFFASQVHSPTEALDLGQWPPSASFAFAVLPYVRSLYNFYYEKVWAEKTRQWAREIQPRSTQDQNADGTDEDAAVGGLPAGQAAAEDDNIFEVRIDGGIWEDWAENEADGQARDNVRGQPAAVRQIEDDPAAPAPNVQDNRPAPGGDFANPAAARAGEGQAARPAAAPNANQNNAANAGERRLSFSPAAIAETVIGALLFPTIAGLTGEALKLVLPAAWTTTPAPSARFGNRLLQRGFLQQKWARSIVGGCLFVVCKDMLMLYVRWKMAQMHRHRKVVDYAGKKGIKK